MTGDKWMNTVLWICVLVFDISSGGNICNSFHLLEKFIFIYIYQATRNAEGVFWGKKRKEVGHSSLCAKRVANPKSRETAKSGEPHRAQYGKTIPKWLCEAASLWDEVVSPVSFIILSFTLQYEVAETLCDTTLVYVSYHFFGVGSKVYPVNI